MQETVFQNAGVQKRFWFARNSDRTARLAACFVPPAIAKLMRQRKNVEAHSQELGFISKNAKMRDRLPLHSMRGEAHFIRQALRKSSTSTSARAAEANLKKPGLVNSSDQVVRAGQSLSSRRSVLVSPRGIGSEGGDAKRESSFLGPFKFRTPIGFSGEARHSRQNFYADRAFGARSVRQGNVLLAQRDVRSESRLLPDTVRSFARKLAPHAALPVNRLQRKETFGERNTELLRRGPQSAMAHGRINAVGRFAHVLTDGSAPFQRARIPDFLDARRRAHVSQPFGAIEALEPLDAGPSESSFSENGMEHRTNAVQPLAQEIHGVSALRSRSAMIDEIASPQYPNMSFGFM